MKVCIKNKEFNPSFISLYGEQKAIEEGYSIFDVPDGYEDCAFEDFDNNGFNVELYNARKLKYEKKHRLSELLQNLIEWDYKGQKYLDGEYSEEEWNEIKNQRKQWREEVRRLEKELNSEE